MSRRQTGGLCAAVGLAAGWWLVYQTGGTFSAATHLLYVPIVIAAASYGMPGGLTAGTVAAILMGVTPIDTETGQLQSFLSFAFRSCGFLSVGAIVGYVVMRLDRHQREIQGLMIQSVTALTNAMDASHQHTAGHSLRVAEISVMLGKQMGLDEQRMFALRTGGLLHDIGKMAIPAELLDKPGRLTPDEYARVKEHAAIGERILKAFDYSRLTAIHDIVRHHHERLDGSGYPDGLRGGEVSQMARIVAVADVYDALTSARAYRGALSHGEAMRILHQEAAAGRLDSRLVRLLEQMSHRLRVREEALALALTEERAVV